MELFVMEANQEVHDDHDGDWRVKSNSTPLSKGRSLWNAFLSIKTAEVGESQEDDLAVSTLLPMIRRDSPMFSPCGTPLSVSTDGYIMSTNSSLEGSPELEPSTPTASSLCRSSHPGIESQNMVKPLAPQRSKHISSAPANTAELFATLNSGMSDLFLHVEKLRSELPPLKAAFAASEQQASALESLLSESRAECEELCEQLAASEEQRKSTALALKGCEEREAAVVKSLLESRSQVVSLQCELEESQKQLGITETSFINLKESTAIFERQLVAKLKASQDEAKADKTKLLAQSEREPPHTESASGLLRWPQETLVAELSATRARLQANEQDRAEVEDALNCKLRSSQNEVVALRDHIASLEAARPNYEAVLVDMARSREQVKQLHMLLMTTRAQIVSQLQPLEAAGSFPLVPTVVRSCDMKPKPDKHFDPSSRVEVAAAQPSHSI